MKKVTNKAEFNKHIECLKAWREFAMNGVVKNIPESDKITLEIAGFKENYRYLFN